MNHDLRVKPRWSSAGPALCAVLLAACGGGNTPAPDAQAPGRSAALSSNCGENACSPLRLRIRGRQILGPDLKPLRLRGFNIEGLRSNIDPNDPRSPSDADVIADKFHANLLRMRISFTPDTRDKAETNATGGFTQAYADEIRRWVSLAQRRGLWVVMEMRANDRSTNDPDFYDTSKTGPCTPASGKTPQNCPNFGYYLRAWQYLASTYGKEDYIAGYGLLAEPSADKAFGDRDTARNQLVAFQLALMRGISAAGDTATPFFVGPNYNYDTLEYDLGTGQYLGPNAWYYQGLAGEFRGRLVYEVNYLIPKEWVQAGNWPDQPTSPPPDGRPSYLYATPDSFESLLSHDPASTQPPESWFNQNMRDPANYMKALSAGMPAWYLQWPLRFATEFQVPMYVDQFGASSLAAGQVAYERDLLCHFENGGLHWSRWSYNAGGHSDRTLLPDDPLNAAIIGFYAGLKPGDLRQCPAG